MVFSTLDKIATKEIYKDFIGGKVINRHEMVNNQLILSVKFSELVKHIDLYKTLYDYLGFDLIAVGQDAYYIARSERESLNDVGATIQTILIVLSRGLTTKGISPDILKDPDGGIHRHIVDEIGQEEEADRILKACNITTPLSNAVDSLADRGLMYKTIEGRYILSNAGSFIYHRLFHCES